MTDTMEMLLRILGFILAGAGLIIVYAAPRIVDSKGLADRKQVDPKMAEVMTEEEMKKYRRDGAILDVKLRGLLLAAPGFALILFVFS